MVRTYPELAHEQAERAADRLSAGNAPLICGLPIAVKDLYAVAGLPLTASSRILEGNIAAGDSTVWRRLHDNGAVLMGHVHNDEFAIMTDTLQVGNPWNIDELGGRPWAEAELISIGLELQAAAPVWRDIPPLSPNARALPEVSVRAPGPGPDPTNTGAAAPSFSFVRRRVPHRFRTRAIA